jgi:hypothetical protein
MHNLQVRIIFDQAANVWVTSESQVPGLTAIDATKDGLLEQIEMDSPELLEMSQQSTLLAQKGGPYRINVVEHHTGNPEKSFEVHLPAPSPQP